MENFVTQNRFKINIQQRTVGEKYETAEQVIKSADSAGEIALSAVNSP